MPTRRLRQLQSGEEGFALIEVLISATIVVLITAAVIQTLTATGRASAEERHRSQAFSIAQEDQARLRAMQIATLQQGLAPRTVTLDGTPFSVRSTAVYVSSKTGLTQCGSGGRADYVRIGSSVTWPTMREGAEPVKIESIDSPVSGSIDASTGAIAITVNSSRTNPKTLEPVRLSGVGFSGSGPATFSGSTNYEGCALFGGLPTGEYTITPSLPGTGWVDRKNEPPKSFPLSVFGGSTATKELFYDHAGTIEANYLVRPRTGGAFVPAKSDSFIVYRAETGASRFGSAPSTSLKSGPLYPFEAKYTIWAGTCGSPPEGAAAPERKLEPGENARVDVPLPALYLNAKRVKKGKPATTAAGALVTLTDLKCNTVRRYKTTTSGGLGLDGKATPTEETPGVPSGEYELCISMENLHVYEKNLELKNVSGTTLEPIIRDTSTGGECP